MESLKLQLNWPCGWGKKYSAAQIIVDPPYPVVDGHNEHVLPCQPLVVVAGGEAGIIKALGLTGDRHIDPEEDPALWLYTIHKANARLTVEPQPTIRERLINGYPVAVARYSDLHFLGTPSNTYAYLILNAVSIVLLTARIGAYPALVAVVSTADQDHTTLAECVVSTLSIAEA